MAAIAEPYKVYRNIIWWIRWPVLWATIAMHRLGMRQLAAMMVGGLASGVGGFAITTSASFGWHIAATAAAVLLGGYFSGMLAEVLNFNEEQPTE